MDLRSLQTALAKSGPAPVYILQGDERLLVDEAERLILAAAVADPTDVMAVNRIDLAESKTNARDVVAACRSIGLFVSRIAVVVRGAEVLDKRAADRKELANYVQQPVTACTLILKANPKLDGKSALVKRAKKTGQVLTYKGLRERDAVRWLSDRAREEGHRIDHGSAALVVELVGTNLLTLRNTLNQLSLYVGVGQPIRSDDIENLLASTRAHSIFELVDAVGERRTADALAHLGAMLAHREPPLRIMAMLTRHFRFLWQIGMLKARGATVDQATTHLGIHPFQGKKMWRQADKFRPVALRRAYERLYATDLALKSSNISGALRMERLILDLAR